jgi:hypothetical protein
MQAMEKFDRNANWETERTFDTELGVGYNLFRVGIGGVRVVNVGGYGKEGRRKCDFFWRILTRCR